MFDYMFCFFFPPAKIDTSWLLPYLFGTIPQSYLRGCIPGYHCSLIAQSCLTLCDPTDYSPLGSSLHGISQIRILEWVAISFSRGSSWPRDWTRVSSISCIDRWILYQWATREAPYSSIIKLSTFWWYIFWGGGASLIALLVKNPPAMQETLVQFLGQEDPLEKG